MKLKNKINPEFEDLFSFNSKDEEFEHNAKMLMFSFLDKIQQVADEQNLKRKDLAKKIGTSPSYITQLFRGDKLVNLTTLAKFKDALGIEFNISLEKEDTSKEEDFDIKKYLNKIVKGSRGELLMLIKNKQDEEEDINNYPSINFIEQKRIIA